MVLGIVGTKEEIKLLKLYADMHGWSNQSISGYNESMKQRNPPRLFRLFFVTYKFNSKEFSSYKYEYRIVDSFRLLENRVDKKLYLSRNKDQIYRLIKESSNIKLV